MSKKARGRPRNYDPDQALEMALEAFAEGGFAGTSLDDLSAATGMNRPSLYAAFGDKKSIYRKAVDKFNRDFLERLGQALFAGAGLEDDLVGFYLATFPVYLAPGEAPRGCPVLCTAVVEAAADADVRADLAGALDQIDWALTARFEQARKEGELAESADPKKLGRLAAALLHSLALRLRAGQSGLEPEEFVRTSVAELLKSR